VPALMDIHHRPLEGKDEGIAGVCGQGDAPPRRIRLAEDPVAGSTLPWTMAVHQPPQRFKNLIYWVVSRPPSVVRVPDK